MGVDSIVEILISPAYHIITIMLLSMFIAGPHQVSFKQTTLYADDILFCVSQKELPFVEYFTIQSFFMLSKVHRTGVMCCSFTHE